MNAKRKVDTDIQKKLFPNPLWQSLEQDQATWLIATFCGKEIEDRFHLERYVKRKTKNNQKVE